MLEQFAQKGFHIKPIEIPPVKLQIKRQMFSFRRNAERGNGRNLVSLQRVVMHRGLTSRGPSPDQIRDQQKATLIEEHQVGAKPLGFFLSSAKCTASNAQSLAHRVVWIGLLASGNSTPYPPTASTHDQDDSSPGNAARLLQLPASRSRDRLGSRLEAVLLAEYAQAWLGRALRVEQGVQELAWLLIRLDLLDSKPGPI
jgi:hypothetical protein